MRGATPRHGSRLVMLILVVSLLLPSAIAPAGGGFAAGGALAAQADSPPPGAGGMGPLPGSRNRPGRPALALTPTQTQGAAAHYAAAGQVDAPPMPATDRREEECIESGNVWLPKSEMCTHGPDPVPPGVDATQRARPVSANRAGEIAAAAVCDGDGQSGPRVQVLYARASTTTSRFNQYLTSIRTWADGADTIMQESAAEAGGSRRIRFVTTGSCDIDVGNVSVSPAGDDSFDNLVAELQTQGFTRGDRMYLVFLDALWGDICGVGGTWLDDAPSQANWNNYGPGFGAIQAGCWDNGSTPAHELMHTLGAVLGAAPNASGAGHCIDEYDVMCYPDAPQTPPMRFDCPDEANDFRYDCNHDDYFHPDPPPGSYLASHWNAANNRFLVGGGDGPDDDGAPPTVTWVSPVGNDGLYEASSGTIPLEVTASDASGINRVIFELYDASTETWESFAEDRSPPFTADLAVADLRPGENFVGALAFDAIQDLAAEVITIERTEQGGGGPIDPPTTAIQLTRARGIAFDTAAPPNLWITSDATFNALLSKFPESGNRVDYAYGNINSSEQIGQLATEPDSSAIWMAARTGDIYWVDTANPSAGWQTVGSIKAIPVDTSAMYDVATGRIHNGNGVVNMAVSSFGDIALLKRADTFDAFITGESLGFPFVLRMRWNMATGLFQSAKVVAYSSQTTSLRNTRGIAVNDQGRVLTILPFQRSFLPVDNALFFDADFPEGIGLQPIFLDESIGNFTAAGMTSDASGRFYAPAYNGTCGPVLTDSLIVLNATLTGGVCYTLPEPSINMTDIAVSDDGTLAFVTGFNSGKVWRYILPAAPVDSSPPTTPVLALAEAAGNDPDQHVSGTSLFYNPGAGRSGSVQVSATTSDPDSGIASVAFPTVFGGDGATVAASPYTHTYAWSTGASASGTKTVTATNGAGLTSSRTFTVTPDTAPPSASLTAPAAGAIIGNGATVSANASDALAGVARVEFRYCPGSTCTFGAGTAIGADQNAPYSVIWTAQPADGDYTLLARATDHVGNVVDSTTRTVTVRNTPLDATAPTTPVLTLTETEPDEHATGATLFYNPSSGHSGSFTVAAVSSDPESGIASVAFPAVFGGDAVTDPDSLYQTAYAWSAGANASGIRTVTATNGDDLTSSTSFTITPDTAIPSASLTAPTSGATITNGATIGATATDGLSGIATVEFRFCAGAGAGCSFGAGTPIGADQSAPFSVTWSNQPADGDYTLIARATDHVGNTGDAATRSVTVRNTPLDTTPPTTPALTLTETEPDQHRAGATLYYNPSPGNSGTFTIAATTDDPESGIASVAFPAVFGGDAVSDATSPYEQSYTWSAGANAAGSKTVTATNGEGLTASNTFPITPDTSAPTVSITSPNGGAAIASGVAIGVDAADPLAGVAQINVRSCPGASCAFADGAPIGSDDTAPYVVTWTEQPTAGSYTLVARATDNVGNTQDSAPVTVRVGNRAPIDVSAGGPYTVDEGGSVLVTGAATDPDGDPLVYGWDLDANNQVETLGKSATFSAASRDGPANRQIAFAVCDNLDACAAVLGNVTIRNVAPTITGVVNTGPVVAGAGATVTVAATDPGGLADPLAYEFDCQSDGQFEIGPQALASASCTFPSGGDRTVTVRVRDGDGGSATGTTTVTVRTAELEVSCTASESQSAAVAQAACDDRLDTVWASKPNPIKKKKKGKKKRKPKPEVASVTFDLGTPGNDGPHTVGQIRWQVSAGCCDAMTLEISTNGTSYQAIATLPGRPTPNTWQSLAGPSQPIQKVRLVMTAKGAKQVGFLREVDFCATSCAGSAPRAGDEEERAAPTDIEPDARPEEATPEPKPGSEPAAPDGGDAQPRDETPPTVTIAAPGQGATLDTEATVAATAHDDASGVARVTFEIREGEGAWIELLTVRDAPYAGDIDTARLRPGAYDIRAVATDRADNRAASDPIRVTVVDAAPDGGDDRGADGAPGEAHDPEPPAPDSAASGQDEGEPGNGATEPQDEIAPTPEDETSAASQDTGRDDQHQDNAGKQRGKDQKKKPGGKSERDGDTKQRGKDHPGKPAAKKRGEGGERRRQNER